MKPYLEYDRYPVRSRAQSVSSKMVATVFMPSFQLEEKPFDFSSYKVMGRKLELEMVMVISKRCLELRDGLRSMRLRR